MYSCLVLPSGYYSSNENSTTCKRCPSGQITNHRGSTRVSQCGMFPSSKPNIYYLTELNLLSIMKKSRQQWSKFALSCKWMQKNPPFFHHETWQFDNFNCSQARWCSYWILLSNGNEILTADIHTKNERRVYRRNLCLQCPHWQHCKLVLVLFLENIKSNRETNFYGHEGIYRRRQM